MEDENDEETEASPLLRPCDSDSSDFMENEPVGMHAGIRIQNLRKVRMYLKSWNAQQKDSE